MKIRLTDELIAMRVTKEFKDGYLVNLGAGIPTLVSSCDLGDKRVVFHSENGLLGYGRILSADEEGNWDYDLINAFGQYVTPTPIMSVVDHCMAFAIVRGGRLDVTVLGALQVSQDGDLANWAISRDWKQYGARIGGAMDMPIGAKKVIVAMQHTTKDGQPKIVKNLTYPLTAEKCVNLIVTDLAVIEVTEGGLLLKEVVPGWTAEEIQELTEAELMVSTNLAEIEF
ncbi:3-oxoacid CoA-transferase subunit B [Chloroflexota bacterium]